jgi:hypothetical protein
MKLAMQRESVESSTLASVGYDETQFLLELEFRSGELYQYVGPSDHVYRDLMTAESKGRFFNQNIRDHFPYVRLRKA